MLLRSFQLSSAECVLRPHTWDLSLVLPIYSHRPLSLCLRLTSALSRWRHCFCWLLPLPKWVGELQALSSRVTFVAGDDCLSYIPQLVTKSESLTRSFPRSFLVTSLADFCGWSWLRPPTMPGQGSPLVSASGQVFVYRSPSPFRVPSAPCSPFSTNAVSFFWGR